MIYFTIEAKQFADEAIKDPSHTRLIQLFNNAMIAGYEEALKRAAEQTTNFRVKQAILDLR